MVKRDAEDWMTPKVRANVIRETFEAMAAVGYRRWRDEDPDLADGLAGPPSREGQEQFRKHYFEDHFAELQAMVEETPDDRLLDMRDEWIERANTMGLKEWQEALRNEVAHDEALRREMWERGEEVDRPTSPKSVLGYDLAEPSPAPGPGLTRGR